MARALHPAQQARYGGGVTCEALLATLQAEPLLYECFAVALDLPIGGLADDDDAGMMDVAAVAKTGPVFDFAMLRLICDGYSLAPAITGGSSASASAPAAHTAAAHTATRSAEGDAGADAGNEAAPGGSLEPDADGLLCLLMPPLCDGLTAATLPPSDGDDGDDGDGLGGDGSGGGACGRSAASLFSRPGLLEHAVDRHNFRRLLRYVWHCPPTALFLADSIFSYMDTDHSESMDLRELYAGITAGLRGALADRASFFYALFDTEGAGHMKSDQIMRMLLAGSGREDVSEEDARAVLRKIDADGSGTVEREEFLAAIEEDPAIIDALSRIFGRAGGATALALCHACGGPAARRGR